SRPRQSSWREPLEPRRLRTEALPAAPRTSPTARLGAEAPKLLPDEGQRRARDDRHRLCEDLAHTDIVDEHDQDDVGERKGDQRDGEEAGGLKDRVLVLGIEGPVA